MASIPPTKRPVFALILAVLQLVVGVAGLAYETVYLAKPVLLDGLVSGAPLADEYEKTLQQVPYFHEVRLIAGGVGLALSLLLVADAVGLFLRRRWGYNLAAVYAWLSIAYQAAWLAFALLIVQPTLMAGVLDTIAIAHGTVPEGTESAVREHLKTMQWASVIVTGLGMLYPIFVLVVLAVFRKAFREDRWAPEGAVEVADEGRPVGAPRAAGPDDRIETERARAAEPDDRIGPGPA